MTANSPDTDRMPRSRRWLRRIWGLLPTAVVILLVAMIAVLAGRIQTEGEVIKARKAGEIRTAQPPTNVIAMALTPRTLKDRISLPGVVQPWISLELVAEVGGVIVEKRLQEGARVKKGEVIALIDPRDYRNALASAKAAYELAVATHKRLTALFNDKVATQSQIDDIAAQVRTSKAAMDNAALNLERCSIRAPMDGVVNRLHVEPGQYLGPGDPVAQLLQMDRVKIEVGIPESDVDAVRHLKTFQVTVDALGGRVFNGESHYLYRTAANLARLYTLEIAVDNGGGELLPDMFARVEVVKHRVAGGLGVPLYALIDRSGGKGLYVVNGDHARLVPVTTGIQDGWLVEVRQGVDAGDRVVVVGQRIIEDGTAVNVVRTVERMEDITQ